MRTFFKEINGYEQMNFKNKEEESSGINCKYVDIESFKMVQKKNNISLLHLNIASLTKHKEEFDTILACLRFHFDFIGITETKIKKDSTPIIDISMEGYS